MENYFVNSIREIINADIKSIKICNLSKEDLYNIGNKVFLEWQGKIRNCDLYIKGENNSYHSANFGLFEVFTVPTQHFYANLNDIYYTLGMAKTYKELTNQSIHTFYSQLNEQAMELASKEEYQHAKYVCQILNIEYPKSIDTVENLKKFLNKNDYINEGNYFYFCRMGAYMKYYYELLLGIRHLNG